MTEVLTGTGQCVACAVVFAVAWLVWRSVRRDAQERNPGWHDYE